MEMWGKCYIVFVTWALVVYLICTPSALRPAALVPRGVHIRQTTRAHVTNTKCTPLRGRIKGKSRDIPEILP